MIITVDLAAQVGREAYLYFDQLELLGQLGLVGAPPAMSPRRTAAGVAGSPA
jgi:hypothetical protein